MPGPPKTCLFVTPENILLRSIFQIASEVSSEEKYVISDDEGYVSPHFESDD